MGNFLNDAQPVLAGVGAALIAATGVAAAQGGDMTGWTTKKQGAVTSYNPTDLASGESFGAILEQPVNLKGRNLSAWIQIKINTDVKGIGAVTKRTAPKVTVSKGFDSATALIVFNPKASGGERALIYTVVRRADGLAQLARIVSTPDKNVISRYSSAVTHSLFASVVSGGKSIAEIPTPGSGTKSGTVAASAPPAKAKSAHGSDAYTSPGKGVKPAQVFGVYSKTMGRTGAGGMIVMLPVPIVVLNDGTFFNDFDVPLFDFDVAAAHRARPTAWDRWRKQNGVLEEQFGKAPWAKVDWYGPLPGAKPGEKLTGLYTSIGGGGNTALGGGTTVIVSDQITFLTDGRFKAGRFAGVSSTEGGGSVTVGSEKKTDGTYTLSGYTLTLKYNDGRVEKKAFAFMAKGKKDAIYIGGSGYTQDDGK